MCHHPNLHVSCMTLYSNWIPWFTSILPIPGRILQPCMTKWRLASLQIFVQGHHWTLKLRKLLLRWPAKWHNAEVLSSCSQLLCLCCLSGCLCRPGKLYLLCPVLWTKAHAARLPTSGGEVACFPDERVVKCKIVLMKDLWDLVFLGKSFKKVNLIVDGEFWRDGLFASHTSLERNESNCCLLRLSA